MAQVQLPFATAFRTFVSFLKPGILLSSMGVIAGITLIIAGKSVVGAAIVIGSVYALLNGLGKGVRVASISSGYTVPLVAFTLGTQGGMVFLSLLLSHWAIKAPLVWLTAYALTGLTSVVILVCSARMGTSISQSSRESVRSQGLKLLPASIGNTAMVRSDRLILPVFLGTGALGVYTVVATVMEMASWPIAQWVDASLGRWRSKGQLHRSIGLVRLSVVAVIVSTVVASVVGAVAHLSIVLFLPPEFEPALTLIVPLAVSSIIYALGRVQQGVLIVRGQAGAVSVIELVGTGAAIAGYLTLIPLLGMVGAAYGAIIGYFVMAGAGAIALYVPRWKK